MDELDNRIDEQIADASERWREMENRLSEEKLQQPEIQEAIQNFWMFIDEAKRRAAEVRFKHKVK